MFLKNICIGIAVGMTVVSASAAVTPDKEWEMKWVENYLQYFLTTSFNRENPALKMDGIHAPHGYLFVNVEDIEDSGPWQLYVFKNTDLGNSVSDVFTVDLYEMDGERTGWSLSKSGLPGMTFYYPKQELVQLKIGDDLDMKFKDPDRRRYVQIRGGKNINVRQSVPTSSILATVEAGQLLPYLGEADVEVPGGSETWYKVSLSDGRSGWVNNQYSMPADDAEGSPVILSAKAMNGSLFYSRPTDDGVSESLFFARNGDRVRMHFQHYVPFQEPVQFVALGRIVPGTNRVDFYKGLSGDDSVLIPYLEDDSFASLERDGNPYKEHIYFIDTQYGTEVYNDGNLYTEDHSLDQYDL